jgi:uncharacterized damage-inducible protein DinB
MLRHLTVAAAVGLFSAAGPIRAAAQQADTATAGVGYRAEFLKALEGMEKRYVGLAEAMPADKYTWRPAAGVRSVGEVFLHVAVANFAGPGMIGAAPPAGFKPQGYETSTTDKAKIVSALKQSFAHLRRAVLDASDADADKPTQGFTGPTTYRGALLVIHGHLGEHLGQSIAYARVNGVVPPWTAAAERREGRR